MSRNPRSLPRREALPGDRSAACRAESGHLLIVLMVGITVMMILLTTAAQAWSFRMRRELELELIFRGEQYVKSIEAYRQANGGAFPVGDLKILEKRGPLGHRYIRKLYDNPFDPNGNWTYLFLHPGGSGFINPCSNNPGLPGGPGGLPGAPTLGGDRDRDRGFGSGGRRRSGRSSTTDRLNSALKAPPGINSGTFDKAGMAKMNLPIVGVVNCEVRESIRTYMGQTWLNQWAFTALAQGRFGGTATNVGRGQESRMPGGLGLSGAEVYPNKGDASFEGDAVREGRRGNQRPLRVGRPGRNRNRGWSAFDRDQGDEDDQQGWRRGRKKRDWARDEDDSDDSGDPNDVNSDDQYYDDDDDYYDEDDDSEDDSDDGEDDDDDGDEEEEDS